MKRYWLWIVVLTLLVTSCQQATMAPTVTLTDVPTMTATVTASTTPTATITVTPSITPTPTAPIFETGGNPAALGTPLPQVEPITADNIHLLEEIGHWGYGTIFDVKLSPDESRVVAATSTGVLWFDSETLEMENFVPYAEGCNPHTLELSYANDIVACIDRETRYLHLLNTSDGVLIEELVQDSIYDVWFTPDDEEIVVAAGGTSYSWNFHDRQWIDLGIESLGYIDFTHDGSTFVSLKRNSIGDGPFYYSKDTENISLWETIMVELGFWGIESIELSDDGRLLALGNWWEQSVLVWDIQQEELIFYACVDSHECWSPEKEDEGSHRSGKLARPNLSGPSHFITSIQITADNQYIIFEASEAYEISTMYVYHLETGELVNSLEKTEGEILLFSEQDRFLVWSEEKVSLHSFTASEPLTSSTTRFSMEAEKISPDGELIASFYFDEVRLYDIHTGAIKYAYTFPGTPSGLDFFHHDSKALVTLSGNFQDIHIWNYAAGDIHRITEEPKDKGYPQWYNMAMFPSVSFDDRYIFFQLFDGSGYIYHLENNTFKDMGYSIWWQFHPTQNQMITAGDKEPHFLSYDNLETSLDQLEFETCNQVPYHLYQTRWGYLPSGSGFFCSTKEKLKVYDNEGNVIHTVKDWYHERDTWGPHPFSAFYDDSLVIGYEQNQMNFFDLMSEEKIVTFILSAEIDSVLVSPNGRYVVVNGVDGVTYIYGVPIEPND